MRVLLIFPPIREHDLPRNFPTGLGLIAAVVRDAGHAVEVWDLNGERPSREAVAERIARADFDVAGFGGLVPTYRYLKWMLPLLRRRNPSATLVVGNVVGYFLPELIFEHTPADVIVDGEGEVAFCEMLEALDEGRDLAQVPGLILRGGTDGLRTSPRPPLDEARLGRLPFPAWDLFPMEEVYMRNPVVGVGRDQDVITSRGCPFRCTFCAPTFGRQYRFRPVEHIVEEIRQLRERYAVDFISFQDDCFVVRKERVYRFCDLLDASGLDIRWSCTGRVNVVDPDLLRRMRSAGCISVSYGVESGSQRILDTLRKGTSVERAKQAIRWTQEAGLRLPTSFILGSPGETRETAMETVAFCKDVNIPLQSVMMVTPYPGTELFRRGVQEGRIRDVDAFVESLGDALHLTVNMSDIPEADLLALREEMIAQVGRTHRGMSAAERDARDRELYGPALYAKAQEQTKDKAFRDHRIRHGFNEEVTLDSGEAA